MRISELLSITISIPPNEIERFLDALARFPHPVNPDLRYDESQTHVEFPAWRSWLDDLHALLARECFHAARLRYRPAIAVASLRSGESCTTIPFLR